MALKRRDGYKVRQGDSAFVDKDDFQSKLKDLRPAAQEAAPSGSFQSMETLLGNQRMEMHRLIHGYHETAMRFLLRTEQAWRRSDLEAEEAKSKLEVLRQAGLDRMGSKDSAPAPVLAQLERSRQLLLESERSCREAMAENFELREQLAAMQAVGGSYQLLKAGPRHAGDASAWAEEASPKRAKDVKTEGTVPEFFEMLGSVQSNPLDRLERAQSKLDAWAVQHHPRPDPVLAGLVDFSQMDLPEAWQMGAIQDRPHQARRPSVSSAEKEEEQSEAPSWGYVRSTGKKRKSVKNKAFNMKERVQDLFAVSLSTKDKYKTSGLLQKIVKSPAFENICMAVIFMNAIWIGIDMSANQAEILAYADAPFVIVENLFCLFFFVEILLRLSAFANTCNAFRDRWFVFDLTLVVLMVTETWIMYAIFSISTDTSQSQEQAFDSSVLRLLKLVRLTRVARIARLLRQVPEVMILLKGIGVASRSVFFTCSILLCVIYIFAIALTQLSEDTQLGKTYFPTLADGMFSLLFHGCFFQGLPDLARLCFKEHILYGFSLLIFVVLAPLTVMNMIVGVLVEVVGIVAAAEQDAMTRKALFESLQEAIEQLERQKHDAITPAEFMTLSGRLDLVNVFVEASIDIVVLLRDPDIIFAGDAEMNIAEFLEEVITLRGSNVATVKDLGQLKTQIIREMRARSRPGLRFS